MTHSYEIVEEILLAATPDEVWTAIATGPGIDSWFMGRTSVDPQPGGHRVLDLTDAMGFVQTSTVTAWQPGERLAFRENTGPDGAFGAVEYLIEARDGDSTSLRFVHNGILAGDDWEEQYDGMRAGDRMFLEQLAVYLTHFRGRPTATSVFLLGPAVPDTERAWTLFASACSLHEPFRVGAPVRLHVPGLPAVDGVVAFLQHPHFVGVRTANGFHLMVKGYRDLLVVGYHGFSVDEDADRVTAAWRSWLAAAGPTQH